MDKINRKRRGLHSKHFCKNIPFETKNKSSILSFPIISLLKIQLAIAITGPIQPEQKQTIYVKVNVQNMYVKSQLHSTYEKKIFEYFFPKFHTGNQSN